MGFLDKLKDIFYEEEELDTKPKKEEKKVELKEEIKEETKEEQQEVKKDPAFLITERDLFKTDPKFKFPINFGKEDLVEEDKNPKINALEEQENNYKVVERKTVIEEKKTFRPSPVISPVYGILDKNYKKGDIVEKVSASGFDIDGKIDVDSVMRRAYGQVEIEKTITREEKFYTNVEPELYKEEEPIEKESEINLFETLKEEKKEVEDKKEEYEEESYDLDEIDNKIKSIDALLKETSDDDFYALVDNMYKDEEE